MSHARWAILALLASCAVPLQAAEPNDTFIEATVLAPGVLFVDDALTLGSGGSFPDTMLGVRDLFGEVYFTDDDSSPLGDGRASGIGGVPTNSGSISFVVSGYPDEFFIGSHGESGDYEVFVDVYDFFGDPVDSFSETRTLEPGNVDEFSFSDFQWLSGSYDVYIDNTVGGANAGDVDFFTFTGLPSGASFAAEVTLSETIEFDSVLGWFDAAGTLLAFDDDSAGGTLSLIEGTVPTNGNLTFAVSGYNDTNFLGAHIENGNYTLQLVLSETSLAGDFDGDGTVDGRDFLVWQRNPNVGTLADWQANYGAQQQASVALVPEPATSSLLALALCAGLRRRCSS